MKPIINFILILFITSNSLAQTAPFYEGYNWETNPSYNIEESDKDMVAIKDKIVTEFYFEDQNLTEYYLEHKILWLNSDDRIEEYNKIYLAFSNKTSLKVSKARVIKKTGEIIELDESKILSAENEETGRKYNYFALEGLQKGSIVEYYYVIKRRPTYQGARVDIQNDYNKKAVEFDLYAPSNLLFTFKSFNLNSTVTKDETSTEKMHWQLAIKDVVGIDKEEQSPYRAQDRDKDVGVMAQRSSSRVLTVVFCLAALWLVSNVAVPTFVPSPNRTVELSTGKAATTGLDRATQAAVLGAALAMPEAAHAANQGYAILQVGWAVFIIGLGPAVLFWIYFNKPEIL